MSRGLEPWILKWWDIANGRRFKLILKKYNGGGITERQEKELTMLQEVCGAVMNYGSSGYIKLDLPEWLEKRMEAKAADRKARQPEIASCIVDGKPSIEVPVGAVFVGMECEPNKPPRYGRVWHGWLNLPCYETESFRRS